jgi:hypothetical protein
MSEAGLESFNPTESNEGVDAAALERMREKMKAARAQMQKDKKQEQKQKKQEDSLFEALFVLVKQLGPKDQRVQYITACLRYNIPAETILSMIAVSFQTIQKLTGLQLSSPRDTVTAEQQQALIVSNNLGTQNLPIHVRFNLDIWIKSINKTVFEKPVQNHRAIFNPYTSQQCIASMKNLISFMAQDYMQRERVPFNGQNIINFVDVFVENLAERLQKQIDSTQKLETNEPTEPTQ